MLEKKKPNILIVHNYYQLPGGEDTVVKNEKELLEHNGHNVVVYIRNNSEINEFSKRQKMLLPFTSIYSFKTVREVKKLIKDNDIDIMHVHNTLSIISPSVYYAAFKCNVPVVQTLHNFRMMCPAGSFFRDNKVCEECPDLGLMCAIQHACYRNSRIQTIVSALILKVHRILGTYKRINYICLTEFNKQKLLKINKKHNIVNNARVYIKSNFTYGVSKIEVEANEEEYFLYVGRLEKLKGIDLLVSTFIEMPNRKLKLVGNGPMYEEVCDQIIRKKVKNIECIGYLKGEQYEEVLKHAKALVVASQCYETFGMTIAEGFSCGIPAIVGNIGNIQSMVTDGINGVRFEYNSKEALKEAIERLDLMDINLMKHSAREYYEKYLTPEYNYSVLEEIYKKVLNQEEQ